MTRCLRACLLWLFAAAALADTYPALPIALDFQRPHEAFRLRAVAGTTPRVLAICKDGGAPWSGFTSNWSSTLYYGPENRAWSVAIPAETISGSKLTFALTAAQTATAGTFVAQVFIQNADETFKIRAGPGQLVLDPSLAALPPLAVMTYHGAVITNTASVLASAVATNGPNVTWALDAVAATWGGIVGDPAGSAALTNYVRSMALSGPTGEAGTNGSNGLQGDPGLQGPQGLPGTNGVNGAAGATGAQGPTGATGVVDMTTHTNGQTMAINPSSKHYVAPFNVWDSYPLVFWGMDDDGDVWSNALYATQTGSSQVRMRVKGGGNNWGTSDADLAFLSDITPGTTNITSGGVNYPVQSGTIPLPSFGTPCIDLGAFTYTNPPGEFYSAVTIPASGEVSFRVTNNLLSPQYVNCSTNRYQVWNSWGTLLRSYTYYGTVSEKTIAVKTVAPYVQYSPAQITTNFYNVPWNSVAPIIESVIQSNAAFMATCYTGNVSTLTNIFCITNQAPFCTGTLMPNGKVFLPPAYNSSLAGAFTNAVIFDPAIDPAVADPFTVIRTNDLSGYLCSVLLADGRVFCPPYFGTNALFYDPISNKLSIAFGFNTNNRAWAWGGSGNISAASVLEDGRVVMFSNLTTNSRIYDPVTGTLAPLNGKGHSTSGGPQYGPSVRLSDGCVLLPAVMPTSACLLYDPQLNWFYAWTILGTAYSQASAVMLPDGRAFMPINAMQVQPSYWNPHTRSPGVVSAVTIPISTSMGKGCMTADGRFLSVSDVSSGGVLESALFNPYTQLFTSNGSVTNTMAPVSSSVARYILLPDGRIFEVPSQRGLTFPGSQGGTWLPRIFGPAPPNKIPLPVLLHPSINKQ